MTVEYSHPSRHAKILLAAVIWQGLRMKAC
ncbi:MAG: hypothetical protein ACI957_000242 [Verrucomicrobiales bacterium]|jgi:hypothetical protein